MEYMELKGLSKPVSKLVMGTAWFNPDCEREIAEMLDVYISEGGNVIDTGRFYGAGRSEGLLYNWLQKTGVRDQLIIMDKACHPFVNRWGKPDYERSRVSPEFITEDLIYSLSNVGVDYFDIYLIHRDDPTVPVSVLMDKLEQHYREGLIKTYGVSNWSIARIQEAIEYCQAKDYFGLSVNSASYSLATVKTPRWPGCLYGDDDYAKWHKDKDIALFAWASQGAGFFADIFKNDGSAPKDIQEAYLTEENFEKLSRAKELAATKGAASINIALAYVLCQDLPIAAVIGTRDKGEFYSTLDAMDIKLTPEEIEYLSLKSDNRK